MNPAAIIGGIVGLIVLVIIGLIGWGIYEGWKFLDILKDPFKTLGDLLTGKAKPRSFTSMECPDGLEKGKGDLLCYPKCPAEYPKGVGPACWTVCTGDTTDSGVGCIKKSYNRGIGTPRQPSCPSGYKYWGGLCYTECPGGGTRTASATCNYGSYGGIKTDCLTTSPKIQNIAHGSVCPQYGNGTEYRKTALCTCQKNGIITSSNYGGSVNPTYTCPSGKEYKDLLCYTPCKEGYTGSANYCWSKCPVGTTDNGVSCTKKSQGRGVGKPLSKCPTGTEKIGLLCYKDCPAGYTASGINCNKNEDKK
jgi:hypothetical protein